MHSTISSIGLLILVTVLYAGYNLLVKVSGNHVLSTATTTVMAAICLQLAALLVSLIFLGLLIVKGGHSFQLGGATYVWAGLAGLCIGLAEIGYFYLFGNLAGSKSMDASTAIPVIVSGTIMIAMLFSVLILNEKIGWHQILGCLLIVCGIIVSFAR